MHANLNYFQRERPKWWSKRRPFWRSLRIAIRLSLPRWYSLVKELMIFSASYLQIYSFQKMFKDQWQQIESPREHLKTEIFNLLPATIRATNKATAYWIQYLIKVRSIQQRICNISHSHGLKGHPSCRYLLQIFQFSNRNKN